MPNIIYIEDDEADCAVLSRTLSATPYILHHFHDVESFEKSATDDYALIISDLRLPGSYGFETVEKIREFCTSKPLLVVTGMGGAYMTGDLIVELMARGASNVISKDILSDSHVIAIIEELLNETPKEGKRNE